MEDCRVRGGSTQYTKGTLFTKKGLLYFKSTMCFFFFFVTFLVLSEVGQLPCRRPVNFRGCVYRVPCVSDLSISTPPGAPFSISLFFVMSHSIVL